jgi:uncharacterized protein involved in exopolysaccharide biosynthesis
MLGRILETAFRLRWFLVTPLVVALAAAVGFASTQEREYEASALVWADTPLPNDPTSQPGSSSPPSAGYVALFNQFLLSREFRTAVTLGSPLASEIDGADDAETTEVLRSVAAAIAVTSPGPQLIAISTRDQDPAVALGLLESVLTEYEAFRQARAIAQAENNVQREEQKVEEAQQDLERARESLLEYVNENPVKSGEIDPLANALSATVASTQRQLDDALIQLRDSLDVQALAAQPALELIDEPATLPQSRRQTVIFAGVGGLVLGGMLSMLILVTALVRDRTLRSADDVAHFAGVEPSATAPLVDELSMPLPSLPDAVPTRGHGP